MSKHTTPPSTGVLATLLDRRDALRRRLGVMARFVEFCTVGLVGATVYLIVISLLEPHLWLGTAAFVGGLVGLVAVYSINRYTTFGDRDRRGWWRQFGEYALVNAAGFAVNWGLTTWLGTKWADSILWGWPVGVQAAACIGIVAGAFFNFTAAWVFVFRKRRLEHSDSH
ncbi:MAG: GtrA family protein [Planctomycetota bacterium]|nr:GtrA family protein [Planctomycetota bacterium]MDA1105204.1 GtrA family protein [Planctomycetota bacterium]